MTRLTTTVLALLSTSVWLGCSAGSSSSGGGGGGGGGGGQTSAGGGGAGGAGTGAQGLGGGLPLGGSGGGEPMIDEVFGHSATVLYRLDPVTKEVDAIGSFSPCTDVIDIAIDKNNQIFATTQQEGDSPAGLWRINRDTAACTLIAQNEYPNSLSFVPEGTLDANAESLVGYVGWDVSTYVRIDTTTGALTNVGTLGGGYISSGDIVSVMGGGTYLTVFSDECDDCLIEVDPTDGSFIRNWGSLGHQNVFGLAYWGGKAYGFTSGTTSTPGVLFEIGFGTSTVGTTVIDIPGAPDNLSFWGAGSSTAVPLHPPS
jgi:hypothetical protein